MSDRFDVAVVGGGIVGTSIAFGMRALGARLAVIDGPGGARPASRANFGLVWVQGKGEHAPAYAAWTLASARAWPRPAADLREATGVDVALRQGGGVHACLSREAFDARTALIERMRARGDAARVEMQDRDALLARVPRLGPEVVGGSVCADDGECNPLRLLHALDASQLAHCEFPIGHLQKSEVRAIARERGLPVADKRDSTGICFIGERPFGAFIGAWLPGQAGPIETQDGVVVGRHAGLERYTLGQRSGLGVGGLRGRGEAPWFVAAKDLRRNALVVVQGAEHPALFCSSLHAAAPHWIQGTAPAPAFDCTARVRYRQPDVPCRVSLGADGAEVRFADPVRGAAPGQYVVFYDGAECLGGAAIMALHPLEDSCRTASRPAASSPSASKATTTTPSMRSRNTRSAASPIR